MLNIFIRSRSRNIGNGGKKNSLLFLLLLIFSEAYSQWTAIAPPAGSLNIYSVYAISDSSLAVAGDGKVSRSIDAGANWATPITIVGATFYEVHSPEPTPWFSLTANTSWFLKLGNPVGSFGTNNRPDSILSLHFLTQGCGLAVGYAGKIEATCDTGTTWQLRSSGTNANLNAIWFADAATGCACGNSGAITCTQNSGATWGTVLSPVAQTLNAIHFPTASVGYIAGDAGTFLKTTDSGVNWTSMPAGVPNNLNGVFFIDADTGYVAGTSGLIMKTFDGGTTWNTMTTPTTQTLNSIHFASPTAGWAVGNNATILKYTDFPTGISSDNSDFNFTVYPNPATNKLAISIPMHRKQFAIDHVGIFNDLGQSIFSQQLTANSQQPIAIDVSYLCPGIYFLQLSSGNKSTAQKIIIK